MLPTGLQRHPKSGAYYLRRRIPSDLLTCYPGKKEIVYSLRIKDYRTAVGRHRTAEAHLTVEWTQQRERQTNRITRRQLEAVTRIDALTPEAIDAICQHAGAASLAGDEARRESEDSYTQEEIEDYQSGYCLRHQFAADLKASGASDEDIAKAMGHTTTETAQSYGTARQSRGISVQPDRVEAARAVKQRPKMRYVGTLGGKKGGENRLLAARSRHSREPEAWALGGWIECWSGHSSDLPYCCLLKMTAGHSRLLKRAVRLKL